MSIFDGIDNSAKTEAEKDSVKGARRQPLDSDIYNTLVKSAHVIKSKGGAMGVVLNLVVADGDHKDRELRQTEYITSGDKKGNKTYYEREEDGKMKKFNLPGFSMIDNLTQLIAGKGVTEMPTEKRTINLYDFEQKKEVPTEVDMLVDLVNKPICSAVLRQIQDKTAKDAQSGEYKPTGQVFETNVIDKFLDPLTRHTASEKMNGVDADFQTRWVEKWKDNIDDQSSGVNNAGQKGAPAPSGGGGEAKAPLFG